MAGGTYCLCAWPLECRLSQLPHEESKDAEGE